MAEDFRELIDELRAADELIEIEKPVDIRHIATLVDQSDKALMFTNVIGYDMPVISGVTNSPNVWPLPPGAIFPISKAVSAKASTARSSPTLSRPGRCAKSISKATTSIFTICRSLCFRCLMAGR